MGTKKIKKHHSTLKFKVVLDSFIKGNVAETARKYDINPNQLSTWRKNFNDNGYLVFEKEQNNIYSKRQRW